MTPILSMRKEKTSDFFVASQPTPVILQLFYTPLLFHERDAP
jgi:hypothetical protein